MDGTCLKFVFTLIMASCPPQINQTTLSASKESMENRSGKQEWKTGTEITSFTYHRVWSVTVFFLILQNHNRIASAHIYICWTYMRYIPQSTFKKAHAIRKAS